MVPRQLLPTGLYRTTICGKIWWQPYRCLDGRLSARQLSSMFFCRNFASAKKFGFALDRVACLSNQSDAAPWQRWGRSGIVTEISVSIFCVQRVIFSLSPCHRLAPIHLTSPTSTSPVSVVRSLPGAVGLGQVSTRRSICRRSSAYISAYSLASHILKVRTHYRSAHSPRRSACLCLPVLLDCPTDEVCLLGAEVKLVLATGQYLFTMSHTRVALIMLPLVLHFRKFNPSKF